MLATRGSILLPPASSCLSSVHLREKKAKDSLSVSPVQIVKFYSNFLRRLSRGLLAFVVFLGELATRFDEWQEFRLSVALLRLHLDLHLPSLFLFHLLHRLVEELLDVRSLIQDHLADGLSVDGFLILLPDRLVQILELLVLLLDNLFVLEPKQFSLLLEVGHDLAKTFLE